MQVLLHDGEAMRWEVVRPTTVQRSLPSEKQWAEPDKIGELHPGEEIHLLALLPPLRGLPLHRLVLNQTSLNLLGRITNSPEILDASLASKHVIVSLPQECACAACAPVQAGVRRFGLDCP